MIDTEAQLRQELAVAEAKVVNWENTFANLSHSLKGSIAGIQCTLRSIVTDGDRSSGINAQYALRNLNLMRDLAFSINHSYSGNIDDFIYDIQNPSKDSFDFQQLILRSLYSGLNNIFDGTNFGKFQAGYFVRTGDREALRKLFLKAKQALQDLDENSIDDFLEYTKKYFFDLEINLTGVNDYRIGNSKSSGMRMLVLFQEIILNAIKYTSFVERAQRQMQINITASVDFIEIKITNSFLPRTLEKSTGLGQVIMKNIAKLLDAKYEILRTADNYTVKLNLIESA